MDFVIDIISYILISIILSSLRNIAGLSGILCILEINNKCGWRIADIK